MFVSLSLSDFVFTKSKASSGLTVSCYESLISDIPGLRSVLNSDNPFSLVYEILIRLDNSALYVDRADLLCTRLRSAVELEYF